MTWPSYLAIISRVTSDRDRIVAAHAALKAAQKQETEAIVNAMKRRSVPQAEVARITGRSTETIRQLRLEAGILPDPHKVRGSGPGLIYAFRDEAGRWWPDGHQDRLPDGDYAVGRQVKIAADRPSRFAGQKLTVMYALDPEALADDSPGYAYHLIGGQARRTTQAVHDEIWQPPT